MFGFFSWTLLILIAAAGVEVVSGYDGSQVVIVYNVKFEGSESIAQHYANKRNVPLSQIVGLPLPESETISRNDYQALIEKPILSFLKTNGLMDLRTEKVKNEIGKETGQLVISGESAIKYLVLCRGVPLKIKNDTSLSKSEEIENIQRNMRKNEASVDNELAALPMRVITPLRSGFVINPTYKSDSKDIHTPLNGLLMVTRLDGPSHEIALALVDKAVRAEKFGLWGKVYVDHRGLENGKYIRGDNYMKSVVDLSKKNGFEVVVEPTAKLFPSGFPMDQIMFYCGWYSSSQTGAFSDGYVEFSDGALGYHLHSYSASTIRSKDQRWVGPLLSQGATAVMGTVYEPYLEFTPNMTIFWEKILDGYNLAQAGYSSLNCLSWQSVIVGDPLYCPFKDYLEERHAFNKKNKSPNLGHSLLAILKRDAYYSEFDSRELRSKILAHPDFSLAERLSPDLHEYLIKIIPSGIEIENVLNHYRAALSLTKSEIQKLRLALGFANLHRTFGDPKEALKIYQFILTKYDAIEDRKRVVSHLNDLTQKYGEPKDKILFRRLIQKRGR